MKSFIIFKTTAFVIFASLFLTAQGNELMVYYRTPQSKNDFRQNFVNEIITSAMDSTINTYGPYKMKPIPRMVHRRLASKETQVLYPNMIVRISGDKKSTGEFLAVKIPINRGIVGYRIFIIRKGMEKTFSEIKDLKGLKNSALKAGQGHWNDAAILCGNGFDVVVGTNYEGLFKMLANKRFDYFPRGVNEAFLEVKQRKNLLPGLKVEETIALYYPQPRFLATNKGNIKLAERIRKGLRIIFKNGTHRKIWLRYNRKWVRKANLLKRKIFVLKNPDIIKSIPYSNKNYWYKPGEEL